MAEYEKLIAEKNPWDAIKKMSPEEQARLSQYLSHREGRYVQVIYNTIN